MPERTRTEEVDELRRDIQEWAAYFRDVTDAVRRSREKLEGRPPKLELIQGGKEGD